MNKKKKTVIILVSVLVLLIIAIVAMILVFSMKHKTSNEPNHNQPENGENNNENNNQGNDSDDDNGNSNNGDENNSGNNNGNNENNGGNNNGNTGGDGGSTTPVVKKLRNFSCRRTIDEDGVRTVESVKLRYHIENGVETDENIITVSALDAAGKENLKDAVEMYQNWLKILKVNKGFTVSSTSSGDTYIFSIKTDYSKIDVSKIDYEDENGVKLFNDLRKTDSLADVTQYFKDAGFTCQVSEG